MRAGCKEGEGRKKAGYSEEQLNEYKLKLFLKENFQRFIQWNFINPNTLFPRLCNLIIIFSQITIKVTHVTGYTSNCKFYFPDMENNY